MHLRNHVRLVLLRLNMKHLCLRWVVRVRRVMLRMMYQKCVGWARLGRVGWITKLNTSGGLSFPLYADKSTSPSIHIKYNNMVCYVDLESGSATGAINVKYNGVVYHAVQ